jgi:hypothetical protein
MALKTAAPATVSEATIWRILQRAGLIIPQPRKKPKAAFICFVAEQPNQMWQTDFTHYRLTRRDGTPGADAEILTFLDDHSRYALSITCHQPVTGPAVVAAFRQTVADHGIPVSVLSDNGMVFTTRFAGGRAGRDTINGFQSELRQLGVNALLPMITCSGSLQHKSSRWACLMDRVHAIFKPGRDRGSSPTPRSLRKGAGPASRTQQAGQAIGSD